MSTRRTGLKARAYKRRGFLKKQPEASLSPVPQYWMQARRSESDAELVLVKGKT